MGVRGVAEEHEDVPDAELGGEGDGVVEEGEVPAGGVGGGGDVVFVLLSRGLLSQGSFGDQRGSFCSLNIAETHQFRCHIPLAEPILFKLVEGLHEAGEAGLVDAVQTSKLPEAHKHDECDFFVEVAEEGGC